MGASHNKRQKNVGNKLSVAEKESPYPFLSLHKNVRRTVERERDHGNKIFKMVMEGLQEKNKEVNYSMKAKCKGSLTENVV